MENWGLITYRTQYMLYNPNVTTAGTHRFVAVIVAHELAHMVNAGLRPLGQTLSILPMQWFNWVCILYGLILSHKSESRYKLLISIWFKFMWYWVRSIMYMPWPPSVNFHILLSLVVRESDFAPVVGRSLAQRGLRFFLWVCRSKLHTARMEHRKKYRERVTPLLWNSKVKALSNKTYRWFCKSVETFNVYSTCIGISVVLTFFFRWTNVMVSWSHYVMQLGVLNIFPTRDSIHPV